MLNITKQNREMVKKIIAKIKKNTNRKNVIVITFLAVALFTLLLFSFTLGRYPVTINEVFQYIRFLFTGEKNGLSDTVISVISQIRFPRIIIAVLIGSALAVSGASYQGVFKNPMISPDILGASAGAGLGASIGILLSLSNIFIQLVSFGFGILSVFLSYTISKVVGRKDNTTLVLILSGMVISSMFSALISVTKYVADPYSKLPEITLWLMGSLSSVNNKDLLIIIFPVTICSIILILVRWRLNVLSFGDEEAKAMGVNTKALRLLVIICSTMLTASVVSVSGMIGWVGLVIPHLGRMLVGPNYKHLMPTSFLLGGIYLLFVDNISRNLLQVEIPIGILTALIGAPFFVYLLLKGKKGWV